jgi:hypothetical protein
MKTARFWEKWLQVPVAWLEELLDDPEVVVVVACQVLDEVHHVGLVRLALALVELLTGRPFRKTETATWP